MTTRRETAIQVLYGFTIREVTDTAADGEITAQSYVVREPDGGTRPFIFLDTAQAYVRATALRCVGNA